MKLGSIDNNAIEVKKNPLQSRRQGIAPALAFLEVTVQIPVHQGKGSPFDKTVTDLFP